MHQLRQHPKSQAKQIVKKVKSPWEKARCADFIKLARGLRFMHRLGVAHRDFKLENIIMGLDGHIKIIDFGVAHRFGLWERGPNGFRCVDKVGTATYMSPECHFVKKGQRANDQIQLRSYLSWDARANDIWTLGIALFMMMFACPPYDTCSCVDTRFVYLTRGRYMQDHRRNRVPPNACLKSLVKAYQRQTMVTDACISFLEKFFKPEPERITLEEIWQDPWVNEFLGNPENREMIPDEFFTNPDEGVADMD